MISDDENFTIFSLREIFNFVPKLPWSQCILVKACWTITHITHCAYGPHGFQKDAPVEYMEHHGYSLMHIKVYPYTLHTKHVFTCALRMSMVVG